MSFAETTNYSERASFLHNMDPEIDSPYCCLHYLLQVSKAHQTFTSKEVPKHELHSYWFPPSFWRVSPLRKNSSNHLYCFTVTIIVSHRFASHWWRWKICTSCYKQLLEAFCRRNSFRMETQWYTILLMWRQKLILVLVFKFLYNAVNFS